MLALPLPQKSAFAQGHVLEACWSKDELKSKAGERRISRVRERKTAVTQTSLAPFTPVPEALRGVIRRVDLPADKRWLALTLDFCEQPFERAGYDGAIIDYLRDVAVPATLYVGGQWMRSHPTRTQQLMADPLFELANHSEAHRNLRHLSGPSLVREITAPQHTYENLRTNLKEMACYAKSAKTPLIAPRLSQFRFPFGACNKNSLDAVNDAGLLAIQWDFSSWDSSRTQSAQRIARRMVREVRSGSIILAHANGRGHNTAAALRIAIPKLRKKGFRFVTVSQMLKAGTPVIKQRCYNVRPGDTDRYDRRRPHRQKAKPAKNANPWTLWTP